MCRPTWLIGVSLADNYELLHILLFCPAFYDECVTCNETLLRCVRGNFTCC